MSMNKFTSWLEQQENPAKWLNLVDAYCQTIQKVGSLTFVLPKEHEALSPAVEAFAKDQEAFVSYLNNIKQEFEGGKKSDVQALYRTIMTRQMQQSRRERRNKAAKKYEAKNGAFSSDQRTAYLKLLEQTWGKERMEYMKQHRYGKLRLSADEREEVLKEFWYMIDVRIAKGELPDA